MLATIIILCGIGPNGPIASPSPTWASESACLPPLTFRLLDTAPPSLDLSFIGGHRSETRCRQGFCEARGYRRSLSRYIQSLNRHGRTPHLSASRLTNRKYAFPRHEKPPRIRRRYSTRITPGTQGELRCRWRSCRYSARCRLYRLAWLGVGYVSVGGLACRSLDGGSRCGFLAGSWFSWLQGLPADIFALGPNHPILHRRRGQSGIHRSPDRLLVRANFFRRDVGRGGRRGIHRSHVCLLIRAGRAGMHWRLGFFRLSGFQRLPAHVLALGPDRSILLDIPIQLGVRAGLCIPIGKGTPVRGWIYTGLCMPTR
ncbi:hypothetical protein QBC47DRAFT_389644 [Echria macrotheca]|uniref:Uncharacterized protein n=1 Tax=Echria macrotheca TaxID=438768 RepID=A0AAJ0F8E8_9PEZI|nr:hypothetical protein QBC47DRAFT_389644 [Echria macrotheca]